jgi:hypothetical protein
MRRFVAGVLPAIRVGGTAAVITTPQCHRRECYKKSASRA